MNAEEANPLDLPRSFLEEFTEVYGDVCEDYREPIQDTDPETHQYFRRLVITTLGSGRAVDLVIDDLATALLAMVLVGREHHARGLGAPFERCDHVVDELFPDDEIAAWLDDPDPRLDWLDDLDLDTDGGQDL